MQALVGVDDNGPEVMTESYVLLWSQDRIKWLKRAKDYGPLEVVFGGPHISQPSIDRLAVGDYVYPVSVAKGRLFVIAQLKVQAFVDPDEYVRSCFGARDRSQSWSGFRSAQPDQGAAIGHRAPWTCADLAAFGSGTEFVWDRAVSATQLMALSFGPKAGREQPLKSIKDGLLSSSLCLQGHLRRASYETAAILLEAVAAHTQARQN